MAGLIVTFSGGDGAGKSTQSQILRRRLAEDGYKPVHIWARAGHTPLMAWLKRLAASLRLHRPPKPQQVSSLARSQAEKKKLGRWKQTTYVSLSILDLIRIYVIRLGWAKWRNKIVVCDRYLWDSEVDLSVNYPETGFTDWFLWRLLTRLAPSPDAAFLLVIPRELSERRLSEKGETDWQRQDHAGRLARYEDLSRRDGWTVLDGQGSVDDLAADIMRTVAGELPRPSQ